MTILKGVVVGIGSVLWFLTLPVFLILETLRYGLELVGEVGAGLYERWEDWRDRS